MTTHCGNTTLRHEWRCLLWVARDVFVRAPVREVVVLVWRSLVPSSVQLDTNLSYHPRRSWCCRPTRQGSALIIEQSTTWPRFTKYCNEALTRARGDMLNRHFSTCLLEQPASEAILIAWGSGKGSNVGRDRKLPLWHMTPWNKPAIYVSVLN